MYQRRALYSDYIKNFSDSVIKRQRIQFKKIGQGSERRFPKEHMLMGNEYIQRYSASLPTRDVQIKTTHNHWDGYDRKGR